nr:EOG090X04UC [Sida crystallina]
MKIASVFVTVFVAASLAQNFQWSFNGQPPIAAPTSPYVLVEGESKRQSSPLVNFQSFSPLYPDVIRSGSNYASPLTPDEEDNANLLLSPSTNPWEIQLGHEAEARNRFRHQLSNSPRFLNSAFFSFLVSTSTITVLFPVTSAVVSTCIPASQFISGSTIPCARRRRRGVEYEESYADPIMQQPLHIAPSPIQTNDNWLIYLSCELATQHSMMAIPLNGTKMLLRYGAYRFSNKANVFRNFCTSNSLYCKGKDAGSDQPQSKTDIKASEDKNSASQQAKSKLKMLLESMDKEPLIVSSSSTFKLNLAKSRKSSSDRKPGKMRNSPRIEPDVIKAAENVAEMFKEDKEGTQKDLIEKLQSVASETEVAKYEPNKQSSENLKSILSSMTVGPSSQHDGASKPTRQKSAPATSGMPSRVVPQKPSLEESHQLDQVLSSLKVQTVNKKSQSGLLNTTQRDSLSHGKPFGIFKDSKFTEGASSGAKLTTWDMLTERELRLAVSQPPANGFQQMINWTKQGKLWQFPINNEQGLEAEAEIGFHEHVFLEHHLEPWCPKRGPLRHFMELVCVGLSKNPYLTVAQKKDHIQWFRNYFDAKRSILVETGAVAELSPQSNSIQA